MPVFVGFAAIGGALGFYGTTAIVVGVAVSAAVGAAVGGLVAAVTGGDILEGMLFGAVGGLVVGGVFGVGIGGAISAEGAATGLSSTASITGTGGYISSSGALTTFAAPSVSSGGAVVAAGGTGSGGMGLGESMVASGLLKGAEAYMGSGEAEDQREWQSSEAAKNREAQMAMSMNSAAAASNFHLTEKLKLQEALQEDQIQTLREQESIRRGRGRLQGAVLSGGQGVQTEKAELLKPTQSGTMVTAPLQQRPILRTQTTALRGA